MAVVPGKIIQTPSGSPVMDRLCNLTKIGINREVKGDVAGDTNFSRPILQPYWRNSRHKGIAFFFLKGFSLGNNVRLNFQLLLRFDTN